MMIQYRRGLVALSLAAALSIPLSAAATVGVASTRGTMEVNSASVRGTANVPDGAAVKTSETPGEIRLENGVQVKLSENSSATVYSDHLSLFQGSTELTAKQPYSVDALGYHVEGIGKNFSARVAFEQNQLTVKAEQSAVKVMKDGQLLAKVNPGKSYSVDPGTGSTNPSSTASTAGKVAKTGLSTGAKVGIVAGAAGAGTAAAVASHVSGGSASR